MRRFDYSMNDWMNDDYDSTWWIAIAMGFWGRRRKIALVKSMQGLIAGGGPLLQCTGCNVGRKHKSVKSPIKASSLSKNKLIVLQGLIMDCATGISGGRNADSTGACRKGCNIVTIGM